MPAKAEKAILYDLDDCDVAWLNIYNGERAGMGKNQLHLSIFSLAVNFSVDLHKLSDSIQHFRNFKSTCARYQAICSSETKVEGQTLMFPGPTES